MAWELSVTQLFLSLATHKLLVLGAVGQIPIIILFQALSLHVPTLGELALWGWDHL